MLRAFGDRYECWPGTGVLRWPRDSSLRDRAADLQSAWHRCAKRIWSRPFDNEIQVVDGSRLRIPMSLLPNAGTVAVAAGIIASAFISEDGATVTAATLAACSLLDAKLAFLSAFGGLWIGDLGVYAIARYLGPAARGRRWYSCVFRAGWAKTQTNVDGAWQLAVSRFFPGNGLPSSFVSG